MARSQGPCPRVWLCATGEIGAPCYRHYHTCYLSAGHVGDCQSGSGAIHTSAYRVGETMSSIPDAYAAMEALGWRRRG